MRKNPTHLLAWSRSAEFRAIARRQIQKLNAARAKAPRCSATAKSTGERCKQAAMPNGTCAFHGGRTPRGDKWHLPVWPDGGAPDATEKANRKAADLERRQRKKAKRLARRSPEELVEHEKWQKARRPGSAKKRAADRELRRQSAETHAFLEALAVPPREASAADEALAEALVAAEANFRAIDREEALAEAWTNHEGVFG